MVNKRIACDECTRLCETFHQKQNDPSRIVTRFISFILGKNNSKALYVPPKFARKEHLSAYQETEIEDSSGERWSVTLSPIDGLLAFKNGWPKFYEDHDLGDGQCLVFNYIKGSHFVVQIFPRSGCEMLNFNKVRPHKNKRRKRDSQTDVNLRKKHHSPPPVASRSETQNRQTRLVVRKTDLARQQIRPSFVIMDDPSWMINRDDGYNKGEDRNFLYDLSSFEMKNVTLDPNKIEKTLDTMMEHANEFEIAAPRHTGITEMTETRKDVTQMDVIRTTNGPSGDVFTDKFDKALDTRMAPSHELSKTYEDNTKTAVIHTNQDYGNSDDVRSDKFDKTVTNIASSSHTEIMGQTRTMEYQITGPLSENTKPSDNNILSKDVNSDIPNLHNSKRTRMHLHGNKHVMKSDSQSPFMGSSKIAEGADAVKGIGLSISNSVPNAPYGSFLSHTSVKKELEEEANAFPQVSHVVKVEPDLPNEVVSSFTVGPFWAQVKNLPYLELNIPPLPGRRDRGNGKVVYLRGSNGRLCPVFYLDMYSIKALTDNWTYFCRKNNIKPGDECRFQLEKHRDLLYIYRVDVTHRLSGN